MMKKTNIWLKNIPLEVPRMDMNMINTTFPSHLILHFTFFTQNFRALVHREFAPIYTKIYSSFTIHLLGVYGVG